MKKKYLKTVEDVVALKDTDIKIYAESNKNCYYQFVGGVFCCFSTNNNHVCIGDWVTLTMNLYILEEEIVKEATEEDIGKLCWFWDKECNKRMGILDHIEDGLYYVKNWFYGHCRRLTPAEVAEITGYKVEALQ